MCLVAWLEGDKNLIGRLEDDSFHISLTDGEVASARCLMAFSSFVRPLHIEQVLYMGESDDIRVLLGLCHITHDCESYLFKGIPIL